MQKILGRVSIFYWLVCMLGMIIIGQIVNLQFFSPELKAEGAVRAVRVQQTEAARGNILSCDGRILASSLPYYELRMDFAAQGLPDSVFNRDAGGLARGLASIFKNKSADAYKAELVAARKSKGKNRYKQLGNRRVSFLELQEIKTFPIFKRGKNKGGFMYVERSERHYPYRSLAYRTIGWTNTQGVAVGIEGSFNDYLCGKPGVHMEQRVAVGEWMPINSGEDVMAEDGLDIITTLDIDVQDAAEVALRTQLLTEDIFEAGTAIVMEVATGEIRAMANMKRNANGSFEESFNYAIAQTTNPGSTFKLATLIALLEDGYAELNTVVATGGGGWRYSGNTFSEAGGRGYGSITLQEAFEKSSNVAFAMMAVNSYKDKEKKFVQHFIDLGLGERLGMQIEGEGAPYINHPDNKKSWSKLSLPMMSMGYEVLISPIHTLSLFNAVANDGKMVKPKLVTEVRKHGKTEKTFSTEVINSSICSESTLRKVRQAMEGVVLHGTAKNIDGGIYTVAGKTGTAQIAFDQAYTDSKGVKRTRKIYKDKDGNRMHQASFAGYFPADNPKYSAIVVLYTRKTKSNFYGGKWAAPVFKEIADKVYASRPSWHDEVKHNGEFAELPTVKGGQASDVNLVLSKLDIPSGRGVKGSDWVDISAKGKQLEVSQKNIKESVMPSVLNMGLKESIYLLENMGLTVQYSGKGSVKSQSIPAGTRVDRGQRIHLVLEV